MPQNACVLIAYGPYEACGIVKHRKCRLEGLESALYKDGHTVSFEEIQDRNLVELWVNGECVFKSKLKELDYGGDGDLDAEVQKAVEHVRNAY